jgi:hypothetical protein
MRQVMAGASDSAATVISLALSASWQGGCCATAIACIALGSVFGRLTWALVLLALYPQPAELSALHQQSCHCHLRSLSLVPGVVPAGPRSRGGLVGGQRSCHSSLAPAGLGTLWHSTWPLLQG